MDEAKKFIGGYIPANLKRDLEKIAALEERSVSKVFEKFLREGVEHRASEARKKKGKAA